MEERNQRVRESSPRSERSASPKNQDLACSASLPPPFIVIRKGGAHEWGHGSRRSPLNRGGTVVEHCRKYTVGRRRALLSSWISSLVSRGWRWPSCSVPVVVMARVDPGPPCLLCRGVASSEAEIGHLLEGRSSTLERGEDCPADLRGTLERGGDRSAVSRGM